MKTTATARIKIFLIGELILLATIIAYILCSCSKKDPGNIYSPSFYITDSEKLYTGSPKKINDRNICYQIEAILFAMK